MPGTENLANYSVLGESWFLEEHHQPLIYKTFIISSNNLWTFALYPQINVAFNLHQGHFSLQETENSIENCNQTKCTIVELSPNGYIYKTLLYKGSGNIAEESKERL